MIPSDVRLYTWIDVEDILLRKQKENDWPEWLIWAKAYWDGLTLGIRENTEAEAKEWLAEAFAPRFDKENLCLILESTSDKERLLQIILEETDEEPKKPRTMPSLARPSVVSKLYEPEYPSALLPEYPPVVVFHSFKGGVGRTLHALAFAQALTQGKDKKSRVLLVDGDLEAPGLTWLLYSRIPKPEISFVDLLALVHGDPTPEAQKSIELAAERIKDMLLEGIYVLPAFRTISQFSSLEIKPEHLIKFSKNPYILTTILAELGRKLEVDAVIIDLRAGLSELSTGLLLDPRVYKVIVTSLSAQSIEGTCQLLQILSELKNNGKSNYIQPSIIITHIPDYELTKKELIPEIEPRLFAAANIMENEQDEEPVEPISLHSAFNQKLIVLPGNWNDVIQSIQDAGLVGILNQLENWLPLASYRSISQEAQITESNLKDKRKKLADFSDKLIFAETSGMEKFLTISPLRYLASDNRNKVPIAVIIGAKGAGKTYTYLQIARRATWQHFVKDAINMDVHIDADVCPVLYSIDIPAGEGIERKKLELAKKLGQGISLSPQEIKDYLRDNLNKGLHEGQWRDCWLNIIAWNCGFETGKENAGKNFNDFLKNKKQFIVAIFDGLEDFFQNLSSRENDQTALRSLLQDVPEWLEQQPSRQIGLLVFARRDMVINAIKQNHAQLMARYRPYLLKWDEEEILRLVAWISRETGVLPESEGGKSLHEMEKTALIDLSVRLWGRKLGQDQGREARTAEWVISVLSDFNGQIQARDIVRLLHKSSNDSIQDNYWTDRILIPTAIRNSIEECSKKKIEEIMTENPPLGAILDRIQNDTDINAKIIPFTREEIKLGIEDINLLENNGVITKENDEYYMPEIFRLGLGFKNTKRGRYRVLSLSRRARR